jgi:hypothetical protein
LKLFLIRRATFPVQEMASSLASRAFRARARFDPAPFFVGIARLLIYVRLPLRRDRSRNWAPARQRRNYDVLLDRDPRERVARDERETLEFFFGVMFERLLRGMSPAPF